MSEPVGFYTDENKKVRPISETGSHREKMPGLMHTRGNMNSEISKSKYELVFDRNGHKYRFVVFPKLDDYDQLRIGYIVDNEINPYSLDGLFNAKDYREGIIYFQAMKIDGKNVSGIRIPDSDVTHLNTLKKDLLAEREQKEAEWAKKLETGNVEGRIIRVGVDNPHLAIYPPAEMEKDIGDHNAFDVFENATGIKVGKTVDEGQTYMSVWSKSKEHMEKRRFEEQEEKTSIVLRTEMNPRVKPVGSEIYSTPPSYEGRYLIVNKLIKPDDFSVLKTRGWVRYYSNEMLEDFDMFGLSPGWRVSGEGVNYLNNKGYKITIRK